MKAKVMLKEFGAIGLWIRLSIQVALVNISLIQLLTHNYHHIQWCDVSFQDHAGK